MSELETQGLVHVITHPSGKPFHVDYKIQQLFIKNDEYFTFILEWYSGTERHFFYFSDF